MKTASAAALGLLAALSACTSGSRANNQAVADNVAAQEGLQDLNAAIGGDELSIIPEAADDLAGNRSGANLAAPPPAIPGNTAAPR